eukprot:TRINITY_DN14524_c0_g1_i2.p1 TRINITY_DN14524_c0_g1~~TRINITY_DN14524_c0_g1_i2.p1  ORF type:complete len:762 (+),score=145.01 TRINITY_DN14524_c0_g1_i2:678-2963(+)
MEYCVDYFANYKNHFESILKKFTELQPQIDDIKIALDKKRENFGTGENTRYLQKASSVFGVPLVDLITKEGGEIPLFLEKSLEYLKENWAHNVVGIFRISGQKDEMENFLCQMIRYGVVDFSNYFSNPAQGIHNVAGLLKWWLRDLPVSCVPWQFFGDVANFNSVSTETGNKLIHAQKIIASLPEAHRNSLHLIMQFLKLVESNSAENKMDSANLSTLFSPNLMFNADSENEPLLFLQQQAQVHAFFQFLIIHYEQVFQGFPLPSNTKSLKSLGQPAPPPTESDIMMNVPSAFLKPTPRRKQSVRQNTGEISSPSNSDSVITNQTLSEGNLTLKSYSSPRREIVTKPTPNPKPKGMNSEGKEKKTPNKSSTLPPIFDTPTKLLKKGDSAPILKSPKVMTQSPQLSRIPEILNLENEEISLEEFLTSPLSISTDFESSIPISQEPDLALQRQLKEENIFKDSGEYTKHNTNHSELMQHQHKESNQQWTYLTPQNETSTDQNHPLLVLQSKLDSVESPPLKNEGNQQMEDNPFRMREYEKYFTEPENAELRTPKAKVSLHSFTSPSLPMFSPNEISILSKSNPQDHTMRHVTQPFLPMDNPPADAKLASQSTPFTNNLLIRNIEDWNRSSRYAKLRRQESYSTMKLISKFKTTDQNDLLLEKSLPLSTPILQKTATSHFNWISKKPIVPVLLEERFFEAQQLVLQNLFDIAEDKIDLPADQNIRSSILWSTEHNDNQTIDENVAIEEAAMEVETLLSTLRDFH